MPNNVHLFSKRNKNLHPYAQELLLLTDDTFNNKSISLKELRIGNLLNLDGAKIELTTLSLSPTEKIGFKVKGLPLEEMVFDVSALKRLSPFSLNQKVLSSCKPSPDIRYEIKSTKRYGTYTTYLPQIKVYYKEVFITELYYLHQFQNLHYYLTSQELKVII